MSRARGAIARQEADSAADRFARSARYLNNVTRGRPAQTQTPAAPDKAGVRMGDAPADVTRSAVFAREDAGARDGASLPSEQAEGLREAFQKEVRSLQRWAIGLLIAGILSVFGIMYAQGRDIKGDVLRAVEAVGEDLRRDVSRIEGAQADHETRLRQLEHSDAAPRRR